jgi:RIO kinase 1
MPVKDLDRIEWYLNKLKIKNKDADDFKIFADVIDTSVLKTLYKLSNRKIITALGGVINAGKEANVFHALGESGEVAVKIYKIETSEFHNMEDYIAGDPKRQLIYTWAKKEFKNLERAFKAGVAVPEPIIFLNNVLIMQFIGVDGVPAPTLRDIGNALPELTDVDDLFNQIVKEVKKLLEIQLVHADLSEYNILWDERPVLIDMGQSVLLDHPNAMEFLRRDLKNIVRFFSKYGIKSDVNELLREVMA